MGKTIPPFMAIPILGALLAFGWLIMTTACQDDENINASFAIAGKQVPRGFTFLREETFSCGGQTNTVKIFKHESTIPEFVLLPGKAGIDPFLMCRTEAIQGAWKRIMGRKEWRQSGQLHPYVKEGNDYPAVFVTWDEAVYFCERTNLRLPTEVEWMYACRGGTDTKYFFGDSLSDLDEYAWHCGNAEDIGEIYAHRVGLKKPNAFGLYDVYGNVSEWCGSMPPQGYQSSLDSKEVLCGGSYSLFDPNPSGNKVDWSSVPRTEHSANDGSTWFGFRPACSMHRQKGQQ